jgi:RHH-type transcriptional regulator, proline utilization regulon repressor / proline dehydrogenase / delta 1-pyrroline-5-carboxylate dehydrogenase
MITGRINVEAKDKIEAEVRDLARGLYRKASEHRPSLFEPQDWIGRMIDSSLADESLRTALFRFVDVLPSLDSAAEIGRHLREYFARVDHALGGLVFLAQALHAGVLVAPLVRHNVVRLARRFIAEENTEALIAVLEQLRQEPAAFTLDVVGEATLSDREADSMQHRYMDLLGRLTGASRNWTPVAEIDAGPAGPLPRIDLSVKVSALAARFDPLDPDTETNVKTRLRPLLAEASKRDAAITIDMEQYAYKDLTLAIFRSLLEEEEFRRGPRVTVAMQAYLRDTERDLNDLIRWARAHRRPIGVRLVKGAYWDSEIAWAKQKNWPIPVFVEKAETDANYERLTRLLLENHDIVEAAFGSHNLRSIAHAIVTAKHLGVAGNGYEIQTLFGMAEPVRQAIVQTGRRVRVYLPVGELIPGIAYLIRRLMENTSNTSFLRQTYADQKESDRLIEAPAPKTRPESAARLKKAEHPGRFVNEPPLDFARPENRARFAAAIRAVEEKLGQSHPLWISGGERETESWIESVNPADPEQIVGRFPAGRAKDADEAIEAAESFFPSWRATPAGERAAILFRAAAIMRERRFELAAWEVFEVGKGWREADGDVIEAIDYLEYYGREMIRLAKPRLTERVPGESNVYLYEPRGIAVIIAPWNFPLAILAGMTAAALVAGNCAIVKPAEQSPVMGFHLLDILRQAGLPPLACQLLQGGGELGAHLVRHRSVHLIAFTGSREVGLEILREAYTHQPGQQHVKRVVCEMGGKNAIVVDADADLDEAITHIIESAFGYQGQKCSAASRLILVDAVHDRLLARLVEAAKSLKIGAPKDPRHFIGPVIDAAAHARIAGYIDLGKREGKCALEMSAPKDGYYIGPAIFSDIEPQHRLAQEEIFGPVLTVVRARDFDAALGIANDSSYALTGGVFSRSPARIEQARREFHVGNLYLNRGITGAVVGRQPFGGLKLSGVGSKAGGPDYLLQLVEPKTVSENTLRHGFVPPEDLED